MRTARSSENDGYPTMPRALFTPASQEHFAVRDALPAAQLISSADGEDQYSVGECRLNVRYRVKPGDFVSKQVLGCWNAIRVGRLRCPDPARGMKAVLKTQAVVGIVGPDALVD